MQQPITNELAGVGDGKDVTRGLFTGPMAPEDQIVATKGGGDYKIYEEILRDDQVASTLQQRRLAITSKEWMVEEGGTGPQDKAAADFLRETLERIKWDQVVDKMLYGIHYGYSVGECIWSHDGRYVQLDRIEVRKQRRFRFTKASELLLLTTHKPQGELMPDKKFWVFSSGGDTTDNPYGMGLGYSLYWPVFFKRNGLKFWLVFLDKFGVPTTKAEYPSGYNDDKKRELLSALRSIKADSAFIVPEGVAVEIFEAARSGTADYEGLQKRMDNAIAKVVLSQVMTSEAVGGQYKADVQKDVRDEVVKADADLLHHSFTEQVATWLTEWNFPGAAVPRVWRQLEAAPDLKELAERDNKIYSLGFEPTEEYIRDTYGEGWVKKQAPDPLQLPGQPNEGEELPEFREAARLLNQRMAQRQDQQSIAEAARAFSQDYSEILGERVDDLLAILDETGDLYTFRERLTELLETPPPAAAVEAVRRGTVFSRLMGRLRGQR